MSVPKIEKNLETFTLTITSEYEATVERVWRLWADPSQLARWWGPPTWPATIVDHDLTPGGRVNYVMTGPDGEKAGGYWRITAVDAPHRLEFVDGFADADGNPNDDLPSPETVVTVTDVGNGRTQMQVVSKYPSLADMQTVLDMGVEEGMTEAASQIPALLAEG